MVGWLTDEEIIYNVRINGEFFSRIFNIRNGRNRIIERPISCFYPEKRIALSLNFSRLDKWRPGYDYSGGKGYF